MLLFTSPICITVQQEENKSESEVFSVHCRGISKGSGILRFLFNRTSQGEVERDEEEKEKFKSESGLLLKQ
jgi:hypothetical protein